MKKGLHFPALVLTHVFALGAGYVVAPKPSETEVKDDGWFKKTASKVLSTTVESLQNEDKILVFSYKGSATVEAQSSFLWVFRGRQELIVPAAVSYFVDLSKVTLEDVTLNEKTKIVTVRLPPVTIGDIAFQPENATTINGGLLTWREDEVEALRKLNYRNARRAMSAQAQQPGLVNAARRQAQTDITNLFEIPFRLAGMPDVKVVATFQ